jgi:hypothetical protein
VSALSAASSAKLEGLKTGIRKEVVALSQKNLQKAMSNQLSQWINILLAKVT